MMKQMRIVLVVLLFTVLFSGCDLSTSGKHIVSDADLSSDQDTVVADEDSVGNDESPEQSDCDRDSIDESDQTVVDEDNDTSTESDNEQQDEDTPHTSFVLTVATWNVERFFDTNCDGSDCGGYEDVPSQSEFDRKADDIVAGLKEIDADVVLLQEVESGVCMEALATRLGYTHRQWTIVQSRRKGDVYTAVLTKGTVDAAREYSDTGDGSYPYFSRPLLQVQISYKGKTFVVFDAHFKSKNGDNPELRLAEAEGAHDIVTDFAKKHSDMFIVLGGDLNDEPGSPPLNALLQDGDFVRVAQELGHPGDATSWYRGPITIDHLLLSVYGEGTFIPGSAKVFKNSADRYEFRQSDHAALEAKFTLP